MKSLSIKKHFFTVKPKLLPVKTNSLITNFTIKMNLYDKNTLHSLDNFALKLLGAPPLANALETVTVAAVGEDPKAALAGVGFLKHHLHADATHHVFAALDGKGDLHVLLMGFNARLQKEEQPSVTSPNMLL